MKTRYNQNTTTFTRLFICLGLGLSVFFSACTKDDELSGEAYFEIEGGATNLSVTTAGIVQKYVVRSNRDWQVVAQDNTSNWVKPFPAEGKDDGIFKMTVKENTTPYARTAHFAFVAGGEEQPVLFTVDQEASAPYLIFTDTLDVNTTNWKISGRRNQLRINISSNVSRSYTIADSWLTVVADSANCLIVEASENPDEENPRSTTIHFIAENFPELSQTLNIEQASFSPKLDVSHINSLNELDFEKEGGQVTLNVEANVDWNYVLAANDWLTVTDESKTSITLKATANTTGVQRSLKLDFGFDDYNGGKEVTVIQYAGVALVAEDFDWVADISYDGTNASDMIYCYNTGPRYDYWEAAGVDLSTLKWTTPTLDVDGLPRVYAQNGYIKLGVTRKCTEIVFKKIAAIQGEVKLKITFKAAAYVTASGNQNDDRLLLVAALNAGISSVDAFDINNFPEKGTHADPATYNVVWDDDRTWSFIISRATSDTQVQFLAGEAVGETATTNRISLDDIVISY
jgi:hypothetical protein